MKYNLEKYFKGNLSAKDKEELFVRINTDKQFKKELLSHCLLIKSMIKIRKSKDEQIISDTINRASD